MGSYSRTRLWLVAVVLVTALLQACARDPIHVQYYYSPICPACEESRRSIEQLASLQGLSRAGRVILLESFDVVHSDDASDAFYRVMDEYRIAADQMRLPLLIVDGTVYAGLAEVETAIRELQGRLRRAVSPR